MNKIVLPKVVFSGPKLSGHYVVKTNKKIKELKGVFNDKIAFENLDKESIIYDVECYFPVDEGTEGGLFFGITNLRAGLVGNEYNMTKGHFHKIINRGEFYWGIQGSGMLILMDENRNTWAERIHQGSLHYIPGNTAHRVANIGCNTLSFGACWPSDAGYNYDIIEKEGFSKRLLEIDGIPQLV